MNRRIVRRRSVRGEHILVDLDILAKKVLKELKLGNRKLSVHIVPTGEMRRLAARFFARPEDHLNVLSFPAPQAPIWSRCPAELGYLGEVYLNRSLGRGPEGRFGLRRLLIHGIMHLLGYHHESVRDTMKMEALEEKLFSSLASK